MWSRISRSRRSSIRCKTSPSDYLLSLYLHDLIPTIYATVVHCMKYECMINRAYETVPANARIGILFLFFGNQFISQYLIHTKLGKDCPPTIFTTVKRPEDWNAV